jgi:DNA-binding response OmpR family regulator
VLLIDDDPSTTQTVRSALGRVDCSLRATTPARCSLAEIVREPPDLIILGINDPVDGWSFCDALLRVVDAPLVLLLASRSEADRVRGLDMGAAACISKSWCSPLELAARLRAILRRKPARRQPHGRLPVFVDGELAIDLQRKEVWLGGQRVCLTRIEFCLLACLARDAGCVQPYETLLVEAWGTEHDREPAALRPHIHNLRQKLEPDPARPQRIVNRRGKGYALERIAA